MDLQDLQLHCSELLRLLFTSFQPPVGCNSVSLVNDILKKQQQRLVCVAVQ